MKISLAQLPQHPLASLYVIASAEPLLAQEAIDTIYRAAHQAGFTERQWLSPANKDEWQRISGLRENFDLFCQKQIIHLHIANGKPSQYGIQQLQAYTQKPSDNLILIISIDKIDKALLSSRWLTQLEQAGVLIAIWPLSAHELAGWLQRRAQHYHVTLEKAAFTELYQRTQGNLLAAEHALQQLALFPQPINLEQLQALIADQAQYAITDFTQRLLLRQYRECLDILHHLQQNDVEPTWIIWQLATSIRKAQPSVAKTYLPLLNEIEIAIKGGDSINCWTLFKNFIYRSMLQNAS